LIAELNLVKGKVDMLRTQTFTVFSVPLLMIIVASIVCVTTAQEKSAPKSKFVLSSPDTELPAKVFEVYTANVFGCTGEICRPRCSEEPTVFKWKYKLEALATESVASP
jgi:hypothetical protein